MGTKVLLHNFCFSQRSRPKNWTRRKTKKRRKERSCRRKWYSFFLFLIHLFFLNTFQTRMHSSRMRTVRCSSHLGGLGVCACPGVCLPGGVSGQSGGVWLGGMSAQEGVSQHAIGQTTPRGQNFLTHACENITFPQLFLRTVINSCISTILSNGIRKFLWKRIRLRMTWVDKLNIWLTD